MNRNRDLSGLMWLLGSSAVTIVCGWTLQVMAVHQLDAAGYSSFIFALAIGSIAAILASALQPVVAATRMKDEYSTFGAPPLVAVMVALPIVVMLLTAPSVGSTVAGLAGVQLPIHLAIGVFAGRLQARRAYRTLSLAAVLWTIGRILFVLVGGIFISEETAFLVSLPAALVLQLALLVFADRPREPRHVSTAVQTAIPWGLLLTWCVIAWIVYGDGIMARVVLKPSQAADYGIALTLGRQAMYIAAPLATVILPAVLSSGPAARRRLFLATVAATGIIFLASGVTLALLPDLTVKVLLLDPAYGSLTAVRLYALIGTASFSTLLSASFLTGAGERMGSTTLVAVAVLAVGSMMLFVDSPASLGVVQCVAVSAAALLLLRQCTGHLWHPV